MQLLQDKLIQKCRMPNPDTRALDSLMRLLEKTGRLDVKIQTEEDFKLFLHKLPEDQLVKISTGKELPNSSSPTEEQEDSLYL